MRGEQEMVQRRVRQHHAERALARRHRRSDVTPLPPSQEHDRPRDVLEQCRLGVVDLAQGPRGLDVPHHQRQRPLLAVLAPSQRPDGLLIPCSRREVVPAETLDRHDAPRRHQRRRLRHRIPRQLDAARVTQRQPGPAVRAAHRLGMEPPVRRVLVLLLAGPAQREPGHRRAGPVVRQLPDDRVARPAVRAVRERVAVPPIRRIGHLLQARVARRGVRRHQHRPRPAAVAGLDGEHARGRAAGGVAGEGASAVAVAIAVSGLDHLDAHVLDPRQRRRLGAQRLHHPLQRLRRALGLDHHPGAVVADEPAQIQVAGQPVHEGPEAHALHDPFDAHPDPHSALLHSIGRKPQWLSIPAHCAITP